MCETGCTKLTIAFGGEGTDREKGAIQHNLPIILTSDFVCASNGLEGLERIRRAGPVVVSESHNLPYAKGTFDLIIVSAVPVCRGCKNGSQTCEVPPNSYLGPVYCLAQLETLLKECGELEIGDECWVQKGSDGYIRSEGYSL